MNFFLNLYIIETFFIIPFSVQYNISYFCLHIQLVTIYNDIVIDAYNCKKIFFLEFLKN